MSTSDTITKCIEECIKTENLTKEQKINIIKNKLNLTHGKGKRKKK